MRKGLRGPGAAQGSPLWGWEWGLRTLPGILRHPQPISRGFFQALFTCSISGSNSHYSLNIPHSKAPAPQKSPFPLKGAHSITPCIPPWGIHASLKTPHQGPAGCRDHPHMDLHTQHFSREFALSESDLAPLLQEKLIHGSEDRAHTGNWRGFTQMLPGWEFQSAHSKPSRL